MSTIREDFFTALSKGAKWDVGVSIARTNPLPLDANSVFASETDLATYCGGALAYVGQPVAVVTEEGTTLYVLDQNKVPQPVGTATEGDGKTIDLTEGILGLHDFGKAYYKYIPATDDAEWHYEKVTVSEENPWKGGLTPQVVALENNQYEIGWYEPNASTVEGINAQVAALQSEVTAVKGSVTTNATNIGTLTTDVNNLKTKIDSMGGIFNFAGAVTSAEFANMAASSYDAGDVILVDGDVEYVCVASGEGETEFKRWEVLGDPNGVEQLKATVGAEAQAQVGQEGDENYKPAVPASGLIADIRTAQSNISALQSASTTHGADIEALEAKDEELVESIATKASQTDLNSAVERITQNETDIEALQNKDASIDSALALKANITYVDGKVVDLTSLINAKADKSVVDDLVTNSATKSELTTGLGTKVDITTYNEKMSALESADNTNSQAIAGVKSTADQAAADIVTINTELAKKALASDLTNLEGRVSTAEGTISGHTGSINSLSALVESLGTNKAEKTALEALTNRVAKNETDISTHQTAYETLKGRVDAHDTSIENAQKDATQALTDASNANSAAQTAQAKGEEALAKALEVLGANTDAATANTVYGAKAAAAEATRLAGVAQNEVDALEGVVSDLDSAYKSADAELSGRIDAIDAVIGGVQGAMHFIGVSSIDPSTGVVAIEGKDDYTPANGDVVIYNDADGNSIEYIYSNSSWVELGDVSAEAKRIGALESYNTNTVAPVVAKIPTIEGNISANASALEALAARVKVNEDYRGTNDEALQALANRVESLAQDLSDSNTGFEGALAEEARVRAAADSAEQSARIEADQNLQNQINDVVAKLTWTKIGE